MLISRFARRTLHRAHRDRHGGASVGHRVRCVDNRVVSLKLVQLGATGISIVPPTARVLQPSSAAPKPVLVERGSFKPVTSTSTLDGERARSPLRSSRASRHRRRAGRSADGDHDAEPDLVERRLRHRGRARLPRPRRGHRGFGYTVLISDYFGTTASPPSRAAHGPAALGSSWARAACASSSTSTSTRTWGGILGVVPGVSSETTPEASSTRCSTRAARSRPCTLHVASGLRKLFEHLSDRGNIEQLDSFSRDYLASSRDILDRDPAGRRVVGGVMVPAVVPT